MALATVASAVAVAAAGVVGAVGPHSTASAAPALSVRVSGNHLVDGAGSPVTFRGVDVSGTEFTCAQNWTTDPYGGQPLSQQSTFNAIAGWHANVVRVPLNEDCWLGINGVEVGGQAYQDAIAKEVAAAHAAGLYVILDLHWTAPGTQRALSQNPMADADHSITFWQQVATAYKNDPAVIFDLYNEPYFYWIADGSDQWSCWLNGCTMSQYVTGGSPYSVNAAWRTAGMQQLINTVRATGATQPILVNGVDWANDNSGWLSHAPQDPAGQLIAGWHSYPGQPCAVQFCWDNVIAPIAAKMPVIVGETGDSTAGPETYLPTFLPWADAPTPTPTPTPTPSPAPTTTCPCSLWSGSAAPAHPSDPDTHSTEVGLKFRSDVSGTITGARFYKGAGNTGTHVAHLWSSSGTLLASAKFTRETSSGWQQVNFSTPVAIKANTTYVASYRAPYGHYAGDSGYFTNAGVDRGPLHALQNGVDGSNGVYTYSTGTVFPTSSWQAANYWVDVVFKTN
jgi:hypothetical protein